MLKFQFWSFPFGYGRELNGILNSNIYPSSTKEDFVSYIALNPWSKESSSLIPFFALKSSCLPYAFAPKIYFTLESPNGSNLKKIISSFW